MKTENHEENIQQGNPLVPQLLNSFLQLIHMRGQTTAETKMEAHGKKHFAETKMEARGNGGNDREISLLVSINPNEIQTSSPKPATIES